MILTVVSVGQMLIPLLGEVQMSVDFKPKFNAFFVSGSKFSSFSIIIQHGIPSISPDLEMAKHPGRLDPVSAFRTG